MSRWREVVKIQTEINEMLAKRIMQRINGTKCWFEKIKQIDKF
jgi:predicted nucleic acid-binding OB-fold protein